MLGGLSSVGASGGYFLVVVRGLLVTGASLVAAPGFWVHRLTSRGTQGLLALKHGGVFPGSGIKSVTPTSAGGFFTTEPPGEPPP